MMDWGNYVLKTWVFCELTQPLDFFGRAVIAPRVIVPLSRLNCLDI